jgi:hypothetical protein
MCRGVAFDIVRARAARRLNIVMTGIGMTMRIRMVNEGGTILCKRCCVALGCVPQQGTPTTGTLAHHLCGRLRLVEKEAMMIGQLDFEAQNLLHPNELKKAIPCDRRLHGHTNMLE